MRLLFTLLAILLLVGCTITKRHFGAGYHVEWKKGYAKTEADHETDPLNIIDFGHELSMRSGVSEVIDEPFSADSVNTPEEISSDIREIPVEEQTVVSETQTEFKNVSLKKFDPITKDNLEEPKRKVELFTWIALGCLGLAIIFALISLTVLTIEFPLMFAIVHYFIFVVSSMISVARIRQNPGAYKAKWLSWTLFGLNLATIVFTICYTVYKFVEFFT